MRLGPKAYWSIAALAFSAVFFAVAMSNEVYVATSPPWFAHYVLLRKAYSILAFGVVAYCIHRALDRKTPWFALARLCALMALYSGVIEYFQRLGGSPEGLAWNLIDIGCGALGALAAFLASLLAERAQHRNGRGRRAGY